MNSRWIKTLLAVVAALAAQGAFAGVTTFANNPSGNSVDFANAVAGGGGSITTLTFDDQALGALNPNAYAGVTLNGVNFNQIVNGAGPGQGNTSAPPLSSGEGLHAVSNYLANSSSYTGSLTISFATPVFGAGLFTIDVFNPVSGYDNFSLSAYTGADGTGTVLGTATGAQFNFQANNLYFLGIYSSAGDIGSVVFTQDGSRSGDVIGLDNIQIAASAPGQTVPEPDTILLVAAGLIGALLTYKRRVK